MGMMEYVEEWVIDMRVRELSEGSIAVNKTLIQYYLNYGNPQTPQEITTPSIKSFMLDKKEKGCKPQYINNLFKFLAEEYDVADMEEAR